MAKVLTGAKIFENPEGVAAISQGHSRLPLSNLLPGIRRVHREGAVGRAHDKPFTRNKFCNFIGVLKLFAEEPRNEGYPGTEGHRLWCFPLHTLDICVPFHRVARIRRKC